MRFFVGCSDRFHSFNSLYGTQQQLPKAVSVCINQKWCRFCNSFVYSSTVTYQLKVLQFTLDHASWYTLQNCMEFILEPFIFLFIITLTSGGISHTLIPQQAMDGTGEQVSLNEKKEKEKRKKEKKRKGKTDCIKKNIWTQMLTFTSLQELPY